MDNPTTRSGMVMRYPATRWQDALPTGSGVVGAMVYGNIYRDIVLLNHDALYYPKDRPPTIDVSDKLPDVRQLIDQGKCREAAQVMPDTFAERSGLEGGSTSRGRDPYQPFASIDLTMPTDGPFHGYRRGVDFDTARTWVRWSDDSARYTRELFVSRATDTVYLRITADRPGAIDCRIALAKARDEQGGTELTHTALLPGEVELQTASGASADDRCVTFQGRYPNGFAFGAVGHVEATGGTVEADGDGFCVKGADEVVLRVRLYLGEEPADAAARLLSEMTRRPADFDAAFAEHARLHGELFNRATVQIDDPTDEANELLLMAAYDGDVPNALIQRMHGYGRYLLICSSRPGGWPANLQGIWNGDYAPAWNADIHTDENIQMNYWQALPGAMPEVNLPLFDYFEKHLDDFRANARNVFGTRGIYIPIAMTTHGREIPCTWSNWTAAAGWIAQHFYDHYLFTGDVQFLERRAVPWLKEVAAFYEDFLIEGDEGMLVFNPSLSPENRPTGSDSLLCINATMDVAICREVLTNLCEACELLSIEADGVTRWRGMLDRLPEYQINEDGAIKEWLHRAFEDNYHHRHQSHLYPVFPGLEVTDQTHPALFEACRVAVEKRLVIGLTSQTGWSMAHMANIYARLGEGDRALECLEILTRADTGPNLLTYHNDWRAMGLSCYWGKHPPFQIDANFGFAAAVLEMLVFSKPGMVKLLPALPSKWQRGRVAGIACRGGITVDVQWDRQTQTLEAKLVSREARQIRLYLPAFARSAEITPADRAIRQPTPDQPCWQINLAANEPITLTTGRR
jgi:alpha-L-fucosidase 2